MRNQRTSKWNKAAGIFLLLSIAVIAPILAYASHAIPSADDFSSAVEITTRLQNGESYWSATLSNMTETYRNWQGTWFSVFENGLAVPLVRDGLQGLRAYAVTVNVLYYVSVYLVIHTATGMLGGKTAAFRAGLFFVFVFSLTNFEMYGEIYTWYTVLAYYVLPLTILGFGISAFLLACNAEHLHGLWIVPASLCAFFVGGTSLNIATFSCEIFAILGFCVRKIRRNPLTFWIPFFASLAGTLINVTAPGNFIRSQGSGSIVKAVRDTVMATGIRFFHLLTGTAFLLILILTLALMLRFVDYSGRKTRLFSHPFLTGLFFLFAILLINFPVCFGYGEPAIHGRTQFVEDNAIYLFSALWCYVLGGWIKMRWSSFQVTRKMGVGLSAATLLVLLIMLGVKGVDRITTTLMYKQLLNGTVTEFAVYEEGILEEIETSEERIVVVTRAPMYNEFLKEIDIHENPNYWVNKRIAQFYGKDTVSLVME